MKKNMESELNKQILKKMCDEKLYAGEISRFFGHKAKDLRKIAKEMGLKIKPDPKYKAESQYIMSQSICCLCKNTNADVCCWFDINNPRPRDDWDATSISIRHGDGTPPTKSYIVHECGGFEMEDKL